MNDLSSTIMEHFPHLVPVPAPSKLRNLKGELDFCFKDKDLHGALACTAEEGYLLNSVAAAAQPRAMLEIGSHVGWSAAHLLYGNDLRLTCIDPFIEKTAKLVVPSDLEVMFRFRDNLARVGVLDRISLWMDRSPDILSYVAPKSGWDFVFIDGWHFDNQPTHDVLGVIPHLAEDATIWLHDFWMADVIEAGRRLGNLGWRITTIGTANRLSVGWKNEPAWWQEWAEKELWS